MSSFLKKPPSARVISEDAGSPVLRIPSVSREDQGVYQCFVKNDMDSVHAAAELRLGGRCARACDLRPATCDMKHI